MLKKLKKRIISILHWRHRNVIWHSGINEGRYEQFGYYECLKCSHKKGKLVLHKNK
jgi:hypothetical protein